MNVLRNCMIIMIILLLSSTAAMAAPASEHSIRQLLAVTQAQRLVDGMLKQIDAMMNNTVRQALKGKNPTPDEQKAIDNMKNKMTALFREELAWEKLEPLYIRLYEETFTEEEVAGMLSFYKTPAGQAVIYKMPALMQKTLLEIQTMLSRDRPRINEIQEGFLAELKAASK
jgi:hypothetical protein